MNKYLVIIKIFILSIFFLNNVSIANSNFEYSEKIVKAEVVFLGKKTIQDDFGENQELRVKIIESDKYVNIESGDLFKNSASKNLKIGDFVVIREITQCSLDNCDISYSFLEKYRLDKTLYIILFFVAILVLFLGVKGIKAIAILSAIISIIFLFLLPNIINGVNILITGGISIFSIALLSTVFAHGFNKKSYISFCSILLTIFLAFLSSSLIIYFLHVFGIGDPNTLQIQLLGLEINFRYLFLLGVILGVIGVLDDTSNTQLEVVSEILKNNPRISFFDLYRSSMKVGKVHLLSMVNTLILAYSGSSLVIFVLFLKGDLPLWVIINSEFINEEIIRSVIGAISIIFIIPLSSMMGAYFLVSKHIKKNL